MSSATEASTSPSGPVRDVNWYRQLWWNTGNFHPKAKWNEATDTRDITRGTISAADDSIVNQLKQHVPVCKADDVVSKVLPEVNYKSPEE
ncbi:6593_t:CDS:2 [Acaulospora morrowiae]|uniref:6593_t:CDS:1 n=1 Tax=Acaulospora morrowiae TaxID=94023 RepID=A0A9N9H1P5_9GLOM|nr:6593_t:CDS:2 [Acaulospora morrowiae]